MPDLSGWILDFHTNGLSPMEWIIQAGGKGANLARLAQANLSVPNGFILRTQAYNDFVAVNQLQKPILAALPVVDTTDPSVLEEASGRIRQLFIHATMPPAMQAELEASYANLGAPLVAVRSSATAEDTLEFSFAGQQDTYLNILGMEALKQAVIQCWSSLWTARAIGYRSRNKVSHDNLALAVVVQQMVQSEVSGVMFTANPLTGLRSEVVIDAAYGLGEALVSGQVEPDQYLVDAITDTIQRKTLGSKSRSLHGVSGGGTRWEEKDRPSLQALTDDEIIQLSRLGKQVETLYQAPQDLEWALVDSRVHLLQTRPVTSLFPIPQGLTSDPLKVMVSFAAVQGLMAPITPLGRDTFRWFVVVIGQQMNMRLTPQTQTAVYEAGERLWMNITALVRNSTGRKIVNSAIGLVEPTVKQALNDLWDDPRLLWGKPGISWKTRYNLSHFFLPLAGNVLLNMIAPAARRAAIVEGAETLLLEMKGQYAAVKGTGRVRLGKVSRLLPELMVKKLPFTFLRFVSGVAGGMASLNALNKLAESLPVPAGEAPHQYRHNFVLELTRGLPDNPTTEMDLSLWQVARTIKANQQTLNYFVSRTPAELAGVWLAGNFDPTAADAVRGFIDRYGARGLGEIDIGRPRWSEDPTAVFEALQGYVKISDAQLAPDAVFSRGEESAAQALLRFTAALRQTRGGWIRVQLVRFFTRRMRRLLCIRESPKFFAVRMFNLLRQELLVCGREMVPAGELDKEDDLFFLTYDELIKFSSAAEIEPFRELISTRRRTFDLEQHRRQIPRILLSDGRAFYAGIQASEGSENEIAGSPVSPGSVEGSVRVVLNPLHANLKPGEIMVCPGTDPSWTPLFLTAGGLIMEVGGMMTHGAVVAREYGIPAVVGVDQATTRLKNGMRIRLDGSTGQIVILPDD